MVTFSDLKGRREYKLCMKTQRRWVRHKQVKTLRRHLKSYITLCNITSCNIMEKWKNRPATVCALHDKVCNITSCNIMEKLENRPPTVSAYRSLDNTCSSIRVRSHLRGSSLCWSRSPGLLRWPFERLWSSWLSCELQVRPALINWISALLTDRQQAVRIGATFSDWKFLKGGVPQVI